MPKDIEKAMQDSVRQFSEASELENVNELLLEEFIPELRRLGKDQKLKPELKDKLAKYREARREYETARYTAEATAKTGVADSEELESLENRRDAIWELKKILADEIVEGLTDQAFISTDLQATVKMYLDNKAVADNLNAAAAKNLEGITPEDLATLAQAK